VPEHARSPLKSRRHNLRVSKIQLACAAAGATLVLVAYLAIFSAYTGNAFYFYNYSAFQSSISYHGALYNAVVLLGIVYGFGPNSALLPFYDVHAASSNSFFFGQATEQIPLGPLMLWAIAGAAIGIYKKNRAVTALSMITFGFFFYLFFGTISLSSYIPAFVVSRYFIVIAAPLSIVSAYALSDIASTFSIPLSRKGGMVVLSLLVGVTIIFSLPVYFVLYSYNQLTYETSLLLSHALSVASAETTGAVHLYITDQDPVARETQWYGSPNIEAFVWFLSQYNSRVLVNYTLGKSCNPSIENQKLLLFNVINNTNSTQQGRAWLGSNCTSTFVSNYSSPATPYWLSLYNVT
jgi:hypothetical protein